MEFKTDEIGRDIEQGKSNFKKYVACKNAENQLLIEKICSVRI